VEIETKDDIIEASELNELTENKKNNLPAYFHSEYLTDCDNILYNLGN
jgi:hypothetical protein